MKIDNNKKYQGRYQYNNNNNNNNNNKNKNNNLGPMTATAKS